LLTQPTLPNTPLVEPSHRFFVANDPASISIGQALIDFLPNVDVVLDVVRNHFEDPLDLFFRCLHTHTFYLPRLPQIDVRESHFESGSQPAQSRPMKAFEEVGRFKSKRAADQKQTSDTLGMAASATQASTPER